MSVIRTNSNEKVPHIVIEGATVSSEYSTTESNHKNITQKMVKAVNDKNRIKLFEYKKKHQLKDASIFIPVALPFMQQISQLSDLAKGVMAWKENGYIGEGIQTVGQNKELGIKATELPINHPVFTQMNIADGDSPLADSMTMTPIEINCEFVEDPLPVASTIPVEQKITDEDEVPLFNILISGVPLQNIPPKVKGKFNGNSVQYGNNKFQLSENSQLNKETPLVELVSKRVLEPKSKELKPQIITEQPQIEHSVNTAIKSAIEREIGGEQSKPINNQQIDSPDTTLLNMHSQKNSLFKEAPLKDDPLKDDPLKNSTLLGLQLATHHVDGQQSINQDIKDHTHHDVGAQFEFAFTENAPLLGENQEPKAMTRSLTYTFSQWQSSPSVTFELAAKGEFIASTASQEVQMALNENKHLLSYESRVHIRREDGRQQQRNQQHDQQQEED